MSRLNTREAPEPADSHGDVDAGRRSKSGRVRIAREGEDVVLTLGRPLRPVRSQPATTGERQAMAASDGHRSPESADAMMYEDLWAGEPGTGPISLVKVNQSQSDVDGMTVGGPWSLAREGITSTSGLSLLLEGRPWCAAPWKYGRLRSGSRVVGCASPGDPDGKRTGWCGGDPPSAGAAGGPDTFRSGATDLSSLDATLNRALLKASEYVAEGAHHRGARGPGEVFRPGQ